jgi:SNF2 family DNA or RNA helicase
MNIDTFTYTLDIDRVGQLNLGLYQITPEQFCHFAQKLGQLKVPAQMISANGFAKTMRSSFEHKDKILNLLAEMGAKENRTGTFAVPQSFRPNDDVIIQLKSFELGQIHINTNKFSAIFYSITRNIFKDHFRASGENDFFISSVSKDLFQQYIQALKRSNFNTTALEPVITKLPEGSTAVINPIVRATESDKSGWDFKINIYHGTFDPSKTSNLAKDIINFIFPNKATSINSTDVEQKVFEMNIGNKEIYLFRCSYREAKALQLILEKNNFNTSALHDVIEQLIAKGVMQKTRVDGELDGFEDELEFNDDIKSYEKLFFRDLDIPPSKKRFFEAQKNGIKFLYTRQNALLGDEVGVGKTIQCIVAASMRLERNGGRCLIITKNAVVPQLILEIQKITGDKDSDISDDWMIPAKWTVVSYQIFEEDTVVSPSNPAPIRELATKSLAQMAKSGLFTVCILDEIHMIKNGNPEDRDRINLKHRNSHRTFNVQEVTQYIPFVWGASATIVANKPIDIYNQLRAINHNAGLMQYEEFKARYGGDSRNAKDQYVKADEIRDLLTDQGVYIRRTKQEVNPNIPPIKISEDRFAVTESNIDEIMQGVRNRDRPSAQEMSRIREKIAYSKISHTVSLAEKLITQGKKVGVFTAHAKTLQEIKRRLELLMEETFPGQGKKVAAISGGQNRRVRQSEIHAFKKPGSEYMAIVISIDAGGTGIDFPNILTDVIVNDFDWSPSDDDQSLGRFYRINSLNPVNVTYMLAENTLDRRFYELLKQKKEIAERIQKLSDEEKSAAVAKAGNANEQIAKIRERKWAALLQMENIDQQYRASGA